MAFDDPLVLSVSSSLSIPAAELQWQFTASSGPGGQHANTSNTRVELVFDVAASPSLSDKQRKRLLTRLGPQVRVVAQEERSQARNRERARSRMARLLSEELRPVKPRIPTKPTKGSVRRRLDAKRRRGDLKRQRRGDQD